MIWSTDAGVQQHVPHLPGATGSFLHVQKHTFQYVALCYHLRRKEKAPLTHKVKCLNCRYLLWFSLSKVIQGRSRTGRRTGRERWVTIDGKKRGSKPFRTHWDRWIHFLANCANFFLFRFQGMLFTSWSSELLSFSESLILRQLYKWIHHLINPQRERMAFVLKRI